MKCTFVNFSLVIFMSALIAACGGGGGGSGGGGTGGGSGGGGRGTGGGSGGGTPPPFGLSQRASLSELTLPTGGTSGGTFSLSNAYPNLNFDGGLFLIGVPGENRIAVVEQSGRIRVFQDDRSAAATVEILDLTGSIVSGGEQGLIGLAFDPDFTVNRYLYVHYSMAGPRRSVISRLRWNAANDRVDVGSEKIILEVEQPASNHNGGMLAFGADGYLYIGLGDGGFGGDPSNNAQDRSTLLGSMLRLDVHPSNDTTRYLVPLDNPFVDESGVRPEIWAYGLRNPFRFSFDRQTGDLWLGDVGQNELEEINVVTAGGNYGWRVFEGTSRFNDSGNTLPDSAFTPPVHEYGRSDGFAVIGGYVYRGSQFSDLVGRYLYGDYVSGKVWAISWDGTSVTQNQELLDQGRITSFGEKNNGEVLVVARSGPIFELVQSDGSGEQIPTLLSQTGVFSDLSTLLPASGLIEYAPNQPFWSDNALKRRWIGVPDAETVDFTAEDWTFPVGTVTVKHFELVEDQTNPDTSTRLETRLLINTDQGWQGFTYRWNANGTDATLLSGRETEIFTIIEAGGGTRQQQYDFPSRTDCIACHTQAAGFVLGAKTPQMNGDFDYGVAVDNQLRSWNNIDMFGQDIGSVDEYKAYPAIDDTSATVAARARAYLDVNCSQCHQPNGNAPTDLDLRELTAIGAMNAIDVNPSAADLGVSNARIVASGAKERSVLWLRMQRLDSERMPPIASHVVDEAGVDLIGSWIDGL